MVLVAFHQKNLLITCVEKDFVILDACNFLYQEVAFL